MLIMENVNTTGRNLCPSHTEGRQDMKKKRIIIAGIVVAIIAVIAVAAVIGMRLLGGSHTGIDNNPEAEVSGDSKILVAYFSWSGNGQQMARWISEETGGELFRIVPEESYGEDYGACAERAKEMAERKKTAGTEEDEVNAAGAGNEVTILEEAAEEENENDVQEEEPDSLRQAIVRPWLQDFTASYLKHHIAYGPQQVKEQIQAVYDAGYEEWILWDAKVTYHYDGLLLE